MKKNLLFTLPGLFGLKLIIISEMAITEQEFVDGYAENYSKLDKEGRAPFKDLLERVYPKAMTLEEIQENVMIEGNTDPVIGEVKRPLMALWNEDIIEMKTIKIGESKSVKMYRLNKEV